MLLLYNPKYWGLPDLHNVSVHNSYTTLPNDSAQAWPHTWKYKTYPKNLQTCFIHLLPDKLLANVTHYVCHVNVQSSCWQMLKCKSMPCDSCKPDIAPYMLCQALGFGWAMSCIMVLGVPVLPRQCICSSSENLVWLHESWPVMQTTLASAYRQMFASSLHRSTDLSASQPAHMCAK